MPLKSDPRPHLAFHAEFTDWRRWWTRAVILALAAAAGLLVVGLARAVEWALHHFLGLVTITPWAALLWLPCCTAAVVWLTRRYAPGTAGSGIPQVMAALDPAVTPQQRRRLVSLPLSLWKTGLTTAGMLAGLSLGREGPSVQIAAGVLHSARRWLPAHSGIRPQGLLVAGGAAGIAAAFNTPLGGVMFAIEELSRTPEQRNSGLLIGAIVLAGLLAVSIEGNSPYFGVIHVPDVDATLLLPGVLVALCSGLAGGLFARLLIASLTGSAGERITAWQGRRPIRFAAVCGLGVALIGWASGGATYGSGYDQTRAMLTGQGDLPSLYVLLKFIATWLTAWCGVPAGIFAPSLSIGGAIGHDIARALGNPHVGALMALGMAGFLAAATQAPLTAFIIVMEMVDGHAMVLSLMACSLIASGLARLVSPPLYGTLAHAQLARLTAQGPDDNNPSNRSSNASTSPVDVR
jgi:H+/Cl- antiporter ClcA